MKFDKLLSKFLDLRLAEGSKVAYSSSVRYWITFTESIGVDKFTRDTNVGVWFALTRCFGHRIKSHTIQTDFSAIENFYQNNGHPAVKWAKNNVQIKNIYKVIDKINPPGDGQIAITSKAIHLAHSVMDLSDWSQYTLYSCFILAYTFAMRSCEYVGTRYYLPPRLTAVSFELTVNNKWLLKYTIIKSKTSQSLLKPEIVKASCCCPMICAFHHFIVYMKHRLAIQNQLPSSSQPYLFVWHNDKKLIFKKNNPKSNLSPVTVLARPRCYVPVCYDRYYAILINIFKVAIKKDHGLKPHGFRFGGISDLARLGLSESVLKGISRHAPNSPILDRYIRFTPEEIAEFIALKKIQFR